jgi:hypothetical protein
VRTGSAKPAARRSSAWTRASSSSVWNGFEPGDLVLPAIARRQNEYRQAFAEAARRADQLEPGQAGEPEIDDREIRRVLAHGIQTLRPVGRGVDGVTGHPQRRRELRAQLRLVLDDEDAHRQSTCPVRALTRTVNTRPSAASSRIR